MIMMLSCVLVPVVTRQDVVNTPIGIRSDQQQPLLNHDLESDIKQTTAFLTGKTWLHRQFTAKDPDGTESWGLVFADPNHIKILAKRGTSLSATPLTSQQVDLQCFLFLYGMSIVCGFLEHTARSRGKTRRCFASQWNAPNHGACWTHGSLDISRQMIVQSSNEQCVQHSLSAHCYCALYTQNAHCRGGLFLWKHAKSLFT